MVCFECQKCNETVKKPKLAKHLLSCGSGYVSCIDCSKVFAWDEWEKHTSCMSEAQKYQGKLFQAKESTNKGQKKQDTWIENVQGKIGDSSVAAHVRSSLEKLLGFDNIPRKQKPFSNFVKNSLKMWDAARIQELWDVISSANSAPKPALAVENVQEAPAKDGAAAPARKWAGWKRALDDELRNAGGELPWKRLREALLARHREAGQKAVMDGKVDVTGSQALASIPEAYLSCQDEFVRLPKAAA